MQPSESAVAICKIMVGHRIKADEMGLRDDVKNAFLGLGSERAPEEFDSGVAYAVEQEWISEDFQPAQIVSHRVPDWLKLNKRCRLIFSRQIHGRAWLRNLGRRHTWNVWWRRNRLGYHLERRGQEPRGAQPFRSRIFGQEFQH